MFALKCFVPYSKQQRNNIAQCWLCCLPFVKYANVGAAAASRVAIVVVPGWFAESLINLNEDGSG